MRYQTPMIGRGLRMFREGREMKSKDFAKILGITAGHYSDIEGGKRSLTPDGMTKLAEAMAMDATTMRQMLLELAASAEARHAAVEIVMTGSPAMTSHESLQLREDMAVFRTSPPMISNMPDPLGLARDLVALMPREEVFKLLHKFTTAGEAGDIHALRKARALMDLIPLQQEAAAGG